MKAKEPFRIFRPKKRLSAWEQTLMAAARAYQILTEKHNRAVSDAEKSERDADAKTAANTGNYVI